MSTLIKSDESYVEVSSTGTVAYVGPDAIALYQAKLLQLGLGLYIESQGRILPNRLWTLGRMLNAAASITHQPYRRSWKDAEKAIKDLTAWTNAMKAAIPVIYRS